MKFKLFASIILIIIVGSLAFKFSQKNPTVEETQTKNPIEVSVQTAKKSTSFRKTIQYPAIVIGDQQVTVSASASGTITQLNFELGKYVYKNQELAVIDAIGNESDYGGNRLKDSRVQSLELGVEIAEKNYKLAKDNYSDNKTYATKKAKQIAELNLKSAQNSLKGSLDGHFASSPISGTVVAKKVSLGDSVSQGQPIAIISKTNLTKTQFFVDKSELANLKVGNKISITEDDNIIEGKISKISPQADELTKRFMVEATPLGKNILIIGSVINVSFDIDYEAKSADNLILPLSAITIGQNESFIFINNNNQAQKVKIEIIKVDGEMAEIKAPLSPEAQIITAGSKLLQEGDVINIKA